MAQDPRGQRSSFSRCCLHHAAFAISHVDDGDLVIETSLSDNGDYFIDAQDGLISLTITKGGGNFDIRHDDAAGPAYDVYFRHISYSYAALAAQYGLHVAAGHGLTLRNVGAVAEISEIEEFNIGHSIISQAVFVGLERAVREMRTAIPWAGVPRVGRTDRSIFAP